MSRKLLAQRFGLESPSARSKEEHLKTIAATYLKRIDQILVQQHVIRRFKLQQKDDFDKVLQLRNELDSILSRASPEDSEGLFTYFPKTNLLCCCMNLLGEKKFLKLLTMESRGPLKQKVRSEINRILAPSAFSDLYFNDDDLTELLEVLKKFSPDITDLFKRSNFFNYFSLFSVSCLIPGEKFYTHYLYAKYGKHRRRYQEEMQDMAKCDDALWLLTEESKKDIDISAVIETACYETQVASQNVQTFGGAFNEVSVNGIRLKNRLILSVPTNETPDRIDEALREFRHILVEEFIRNTGGYHNVSRPDFDDSIFMTQFTHEPCLLKDWDQLQKQFVGLWVWDVIFTEQPKNVKVKDACEIVVQGLERIKVALNHKAPTYQHETIHRYYENITKEIGPRLHKNLAVPTRIDKFLTGDTGKVLGALCELLD